MDFAIPEKLRLGGFTIMVQYKDNLFLSTGNLGESQHVTKVIRLDPQMPWEEMQDTFIHEALHHINSHYGLKLPEKTIELLSHGIYEVIQQLKPERKMHKGGNV